MNAHRPGHPQQMAYWTYALRDNDDGDVWARESCAAFVLTSDRDSAQNWAPVAGLTKLGHCIALRTI